MFTLHPFKQAERDRKKADDLRERTILECDLKIDFFKFQSIFANLNIENRSTSNRTNRMQEKLLNEQIAQKFCQQKLYYQNEQFKIQQKSLITKILETGSSKFHYLRNEFPKYSLYVFINELNDSLIIEYYKKVKENNKKLGIVQDKLTEIIKLLNISKIQEEKKSKDELLKSKFYKEQNNKKKSDQFLLSNKITMEIIRYIEQLISNFQKQQEQINESKNLSKKICYLFINEEILSINQIVNKMNKYFQKADEIESVVKFKTKFSSLSEKWSDARSELQKNDEIISKETNQIELQKLDKKRHILNNNINHIKNEIAYFYVKLIIFCNDDSKENLIKLLEEYKNPNLQLKEDSKNNILVLETKIEADYYDKNNNTLYKGILVAAMTLIKGKNNREHSKNFISVIIDKLKKKVEDKMNNDNHDSSNTREFMNGTIGMQEKLNYTDDNLILNQSFEPEQYEEVIKILTKKRSLKVSESKQCDSEIQSIDELFDKLSKSKDLLIKSEQKHNEIKKEDVESTKSEQGNEEMMEEDIKSSTNSEQGDEWKNMIDIEGCPKICLENYVINDHISKGSSGSILKAIDKTTNKKVAIKSYSYEISNEDIIRIVKISNTNIIGLAKTIGFHFDFTNEEIKNIKNEIRYFTAYFRNGCIVMDLYKNVDLYAYNQKYLNSNGQFNPTIRSKIIFGVAAIMKKLHEKQIVHRDLKISNILLDDNNEPIICDFELSFNVNDESFEKNLNKEDSIQGTPIYISPEKITFEEDKTNTFASDVYSYAMILYRMFSTSISFSNNNHNLNHSTFLYLKNIAEGIRPIKPKNIPEHYWELIQMCWNPNPFQRPTFKEITDILKDDKYALNEFGMETDINELHDYQRKLGEYTESVIVCI